VPVLRRHTYLCALACATVLAGTALSQMGVSRSVGNPAAIAKRLDHFPLDFEQNAGQTSAKFLARGSGYVAALRDGPTYRLAVARHGSQPALLEVKLAHARKSVAQGVDPLPGTSNYFIGNDPRTWRTGIRHFAKVSYSNVYPGIDLVFYGNQKRLEHDFVVAPGADPTRIAMQIDGADSLEVTHSGDLELQLSAGKMVFEKPVAYQEEQGRRSPVACAYGTRHHSVYFVVGDYDRSRALVIDPVLTYSTLLGGSNNDQATGIALDSLGEAYVTGYTLSSDFPTQGALQSTCTNSCGAFDVFITKLNANGSGLVYSTYLGGSGNDYGYAIAVDPNGYAYVTGYTTSSDFPTVNAAQPSFGNGFTHAFVAKLNASGSALVYSTYLGGSGTESGESPIKAAVAADANGNAYVGGGTNSNDFPVLNAAFSTYGGSGDGYLAKYGPTGTKLFATYLGGNAADGIRGIALDSANPPNIYVTGDTASPNFPTTAGAFQSSCGTDGNCNGNQSDAFVAKFTNTGTLVYSTFIGGDQIDYGNAVAVDGSGNAYVTGHTTSSSSFLSPNGGFPVLGGVQSVCIGCNSFLSDSFITKVNPSGSELVYSTYLGGNGDSEGTSIGVDSNGFAYVTGYTTAPDFLLSNPFQSSGGGGVFAVSNTGAITTSNTGFASSSAGQFVADSTGIYGHAVNPSFPDQSFGLFKSTDGGVTWSKLPNAPAFLRVVTLDPSNPGTIYGAVDIQNEVVKSTDGGNTWSSSTTGLPTFSQYDSLAVDPSNAKRVFLGTAAGIYLSSDAGATWASSSTGLPAPGFGNTNFSNITSIIIDSSTPATIYANLTGNSFGNTVIGIYKSTDGGAHWSFSSSGLQPASSSSACCNNISSLAMDPNNHLVLYAGTPPQFFFGSPPSPPAGIFKTTNGGGIWTEILDTATNNTNSTISALALDASSNLYAGLSGVGQRNGLIKSTDGGVHWTDLGLDGGDVKAILAGSTTLAGTSDNLPAGAGGGFVIFPAVNGDPTAFVARLNVAGDSLDYSTYLGGTNAAQASAITVNPSTGDAYVTGTTDPDFPITLGAFQTMPHQSQLTFTGALSAINGLNNDAFVSVIPGQLPSTTLLVAPPILTDLTQPGSTLYDSDIVKITTTVTNTGTNFAAGVVLSGIAPGVFNPSTVTGSPFCTVNPATGSFLCAQPTALPPGGVYTVNFNATAAQAGSFMFTPAAQADSAPVVTNSVSGTVQHESNLVTTKTMTSTSDTHQVNVGDTVLIIITVTNSGPDDEPAGATLLDVLPSGVTNCMVVKDETGGFSSVTPTSSSVNATLDLLQAPGPTYPQGETATLYLLCTATTAGPQKNTANITSTPNHYDPGKSTTSASDSISVNPKTGPLTITKSASTTEASPGERFTYTITVTNTGSAPATHLNIYDQLDHGLAIDFSVQSGPYGPGAVNCNFPSGGGISSGNQNGVSSFNVQTGSLAPGQSFMCSAAVVVVMNLFSQLTPENNIATLTADGVSAINSNNAVVQVKTPSVFNFDPPPIGNCEVKGKTCAQTATVTPTEPTFDTLLTNISVDPACGGTIATCSIGFISFPVIIPPSRTFQFPIQVACFAAGAVNTNITIANNTTMPSVTAPLTADCDGPGPATRLTVSAPLTVVGGTATNITVTAYDQYGNVATGYTGTVHFTSTDGKATLPADYTFVAGDKGMHTFSVTLNTVGSQTVTATDTTTSTITGTSNKINVTGNTASTVTINSSKNGGLNKPSIFTVTVTPAGATGSVQLYFENSESSASPYGQPVVLTGGQATISVELPPGMGIVTVQYLGDGTYAASTSGEQAVNTPRGPLGQVPR